MRSCECCGFDTPEEELMECPVCGKLVCDCCADDEGRCWDCHEAFEKGHII